MPENRVEAERQLLPHSQDVARYARDGIEPHRTMFGNWPT